MHAHRFRLIAAAGLIVAGTAAWPVLHSAQPAPVAPMQEWPVYGADPGGTKYSPLVDINRENVATLKVAWEWVNTDRAIEQFGTRPGNFQATPLMIDNVLYVSTPYNRVVALEAETGRELWSFDPKPYEDGQPPNGTGFVHRGVAAWRDKGRLRIFINSRYRLICLDGATGTPITTFGVHGVVDLSQGLLWPIEKKHYTQTSPPVVYKDLVIVGNGVGDRLVYKKDPPGDVRAFDARTGRQVWSFHTIPQAGEYGHDTWEREATSYTGHVNIWAPMTLDAARGLVYLPGTTPSNDYYGGRRKGANLFAEALICLDAATGKRKWHYQIVHHGLWDYDLPSPPNLVTITVNGRKIDAVAQLTKQGFVFVFDRVTGEPVWPIEERPVGKSDVPGEQAWPTQPFPTRPPAFESQGVSLEDANDLTPAIKAAAQAQMRQFRLGPLYTPPSLEGTLMLPGNIGGANWGGGAFDPESGILYVRSSRTPWIARVGKPPVLAPDHPRYGEVDAEISGVLGGQGAFIDGVPIIKPPYGHLTAIDLNRGEIKWRVPFGDMSQLRTNPTLKDATLPAVLGSPGAPGTLATRGGLLFVGGGDEAFHAVDTDTGRELWRLPLPRRLNGTPMTYRAKSGRQFVVVATGSGDDTRLVAFAVPGPTSTR